MKWAAIHPSIYHYIISIHISTAVVDSVRLSTPARIQLRWLAVCK